MAQFLDTQGISHKLSQIIKEAKETLILISPYLKIPDRFRELLEDKDRIDMEMWLLYGKDELEQREYDWLRSLRHLKTGFCRNLHAKCYLNEEEALIASMNLHEFSQVNNNEMGIAVTKKEDPALYAQIFEEARRLIRISSEDTDRKAEADTRIERAEGHCIRCGIVIKRDPRHPYCLKDYERWKLYGDKNYIEKNGHCHACGRPNASSMERPVCVECYKKRGKAERRPTFTKGRKNS